MTSFVIYIKCYPFLVGLSNVRPFSRKCRDYSIRFKFSSAFFFFFFIYYKTIRKPTVYRRKPEFAQSLSDQGLNFQPNGGRFRRIIRKIYRSSIPKICWSIPEGPTPSVLTHREHRSSIKAISRRRKTCIIIVTGSFSSRLFITISSVDHQGKRYNSCVPLSSGRTVFFSFFFISRSEGKKSLDSETENLLSNASEKKKKTFYYVQVREISSTLIRR